MAVNIGYKAIQIYKFGSTTDGDASMKEVLGGKGANLAEMASLGFPVPPGFTIPCSASVRYNALKGDKAKLVIFQMSLWDQVQRGIKYLEKEFGYMPLVSVRSGARVSMPGMMDTILNVGLTSETLPFWSEKLGERAALDSYRRLIQMYGSVAMDVPMFRFEDALHAVKVEAKVEHDHQLSVEALKGLVRSYKAIVVDMAGREFPDTLDAQLKGAIGAVFRSWNNERAIEYRRINGIPETWGTAVNVQAMVFGNLNDSSCTGVLFSRNPSTGENVVTGEFLVNAQGEDVVAGIRTPEALPKLADWNPVIAAELYGVVAKLEDHYKDMQDVEFTVQEGKLFILQTRSGKRAPMAAFQIAHDMAMEGFITKETAVKRVSQAQLLAAMSDMIDPTFKVKPNLVGIAAGGGVVTGVAVFTSQDAVNCKEPCILVRKETDPDDIAGMNAAVGILTATGGLTSHAAVVARGMNKTCVVGCTDLETTDLGGTFGPGDKLTIDGATGSVWCNVDVPVVSAANNPAIKALVSWAAGEGVVERVTFSGRLTEAEVIEKASKLTGKVHIDTATFDKPDTCTTYEMMVALGTGLAKSSVSAVFVDTKGLGHHLGQSDDVFDWMFGAKINTQSVSDSKYKAMMMWGDLLEKVTIRKSDDDHHDNVASLVKMGVRVSGKIATFADLLAADGPMEIDAEVIQKVFGTVQAYEKAKAMIEQTTGKSLNGTSVQPMYWYEFLTSGKEAA